MERNITFIADTGDLLERQESVDMPIDEFKALVEWLKRQTLQYDLTQARDAINRLSSFADRL